MKYIVCLSLLFYTFSAFAQEKGFLFSLGEKILNIAGFSYKELEQKLAKLTTVDNERKECLFNLSEREKDLKDCPAYESFKAPPFERGIGFNVKDIMGAGCAGHIKMTTKRFDKFRGNSEGSFEAEISIEKEGQSLAIRNPKKVIVPNTYSDKIDITLFDFKIKTSPPNITLNRFYESQDESSGGSLDKGVYKYKYVVAKNTENKLEINFEGEQAEQLQSGMLELQSSYKIFCVSKSIEELEK